MSQPAAPSDEHATPLTPEEEAQFIPSFITTRDELNRAEQQGIADARRAVMKRSPDPDKLLTVTYLLALHRRMFGPVWKWAGKLRTTERNIGVEAWHIRTELQRLVDDARAWLQHESYPPDEIGVRLHHRLVAIHCFANGNGRHARLVADLLVVARGRPAFSWGAGDLAPAGQVRRSYIDALQQADQGDYAALATFARN